MGAAAAASSAIAISATMTMPATFNTNNVAGLEPSHLRAPRACSRRHPRHRPHASQNLRFVDHAIARFSAGRLQAHHFKTNFVLQLLALFCDASLSISSKHYEQLAHHSSCINHASSNPKPFFLSKTENPFSSLMSPQTAVMLHKTECTVAEAPRALFVGFDIPNK